MSVAQPFLNQHQAEMTDHYLQIRQDVTYHNCSIAAIGVKLLSDFVQNDLVGRSILMAFCLSSAVASSCGEMLQKIQT